ncbi:hypothetical protein ACFWIX_03765 [Pseudarthrobacter sp. NPDC058362]|uniref:hypothetical protein n=1 Tax=unclassified Pseudarthrobacter TaxID=2647000 RepID=UPI00365EA9AB
MAPEALSRGRIIVPGTQHQLGMCGLFPPSSAQRRPVAAAGHILEAKACVPGLLWLSFGELCAPDLPPAALKALAAEHSLWVVDDVPPPGAVPSGVSRPGTWRCFADVLAALAATNTALFLVAREVPRWLEAAAADPEAKEPLQRIDGMLAGLPLMESDVRLVEGISGS